MSKLRNVRTEINKMRKELEAKEAELRKEKLAPSIEAISDVLLGDEAVCNVLDGADCQPKRPPVPYLAASL